MKNLIDIIDTGFIITLALIIFICGSIGVYFYRRLSILENSIIEQGKVLQAFIQNYNSHLSKNNIFNSNNQFGKIDVSESNSEKDYTQVFDNKINNNHDSDDDSDHDSDTDNDDDSHDDSDDDSDSDDDKEDDNQINNHNDNNVHDNDNSDNDNEYNITSDNIMIDNNDVKNLTDKLIDYEFDLKTLNVNDEILLNVYNENILGSSTKRINIIEIDEDNNNNENSNENASESTNENKKKNINKMNVSDLKTLVVTENLIDNENAQKLKKNELIKLLQKN